MYLNKIHKNSLKKQTKTKRTTRAFKWFKLYLRITVKSSASLFSYEHLNVYHLSPSGIWGRGLWLRCTAERHCSYEPPMGFRTSPAWSRQPRRSLMSSRRPRWFLPGQSPAARHRTPHGRRWGTGDTPAEAKTCPEYACSKSLPKSQERKKRKMMQEKKRKERRNPQKRTAKAGQLKNKTGWPPLKKRRICQPSLPPSCVSGAVWHFRVRSWCVCLAAGASGCGAEWLIGSLLKHQAPPMPGAGD